MIDRHSSLARTVRAIDHTLYAMLRFLGYCAVIVAIILGMLLHAAFMNSAGKD